MERVRLWAQVSIRYGLNDKNADHLQEAVDKALQAYQISKAIVADEMKRGLHDSK